MKNIAAIPPHADVIGTALAARRPRRPQRMAREAATPLDVPAADAAATSNSAPRSQSKIASVIALLKREQGATLEELTKATSWLPHTTRAVLTGLRKKGHVLAKDKRGDATCYRIEAAGE